jgi:quercetin dioxygenase-like cupin family protein
MIDCEEERMSEIHADRRPPSAPEGPLDLEGAGESLLDEARGMSSGRAAKSLTPGAHAPLKQTLIALRAGVELSEHQTNGPATIHLLRGRATINSDEGAIELQSGQWAAIPAVRHNLQSSADTVALITVAPTAEPPGPRT